MAGKRKDESELGMTGTEASPTEAAEVPASDPQPETTGPPPGDYCILVNKRKAPLSCPLRDGTHVALGPKCVGRNIHVSKPILKKVRTDQLFKWEKLGWLEFQEYKGGE